MSTLFSIGIIGNGFVGKATSLLKNTDVAVKIYDIDPKKCVPLGTTLLDVCDTNVIFICVPTPMRSTEDTESDTSIVENVIDKVKSAVDKSETPKAPFIVVRSTVPVGFCHKFGVHHFPEFLTERGWEEDFKTSKHFIIGINKQSSHDQERRFELLMKKIFYLAKENDCVSSCDVRFCNTDTSELVKYTRNAYLATKVSFFNEIYDFAKKKNLNYNIFAELVALDERITNSHTKVPGPDGQRGWGGTCLPKDTLSLLHQFSENNVESYVIKSTIHRNLKIDRKDKDWEELYGRSISIPLEDSIDEI